jgi:hypothetical protein
MPLPALIDAMPRSMASSSSGVRSIGGASSRNTTVSSEPSGNFALVTILPFTTLARAAFIIDRMARARGPDPTCAWSKVIVRSRLAWKCLSYCRGGRRRSVSSGFGV